MLHTSAIDRSADYKLDNEFKPVCWCITDGRHSLENQTAGLARAMGLKPVMKRVLLRSPWRVVSPYINPFMSAAISPAGDMLAPPWPDLVIAAGRPSILPAMLVKQRSHGRTFTVLLQDSFRHRNAFDRLVVPAHDRLSGPNIIVTDGALHSVTQQAVANGGESWRERFAHVPKPAVAVLLGGSNSRYTLDETVMADLARNLTQVASQGYGLLVTPSRRTGERNVAKLQQALAGTGAFIWNGEGDNPYFGMLAHACSIIVTADSVNMITEACSTGKPVYVVELPRKLKFLAGRDKFAHFRAGLEQGGRIRRFDGCIDSWTYEPLREVDRVAGLIRDAMREAAHDRD